MNIVKEAFESDLKDLVMSGIVEKIEVDGEESYRLTKVGFEYAKKMYMTTPEQEERFEKRFKQ